MSDGRLRSLADFEWVSVARYLIYISSVADLKEFNVSDVYSFPVTKNGVDRVIARKERIKALLSGNIKQLERFVGAHEESLGDDEKAVLRGVYVQYKKAVETVSDHISVACAYKEAQQTGLLPYMGGDEDELPF